MSVTSPDCLMAGQLGLLAPGTDPDIELKNTRCRQPVFDIGGQIANGSGCYPVLLS
jgi:hypothetical protein